MLLLLLAACPDSSSPSDTSSGKDSGGVDSGDTGDSPDTTDTADTVPVIDTATLPPVECPASSGYTPAADRPARIVNGTAVWTLDFDADAEAAGFHDCTYTRVYTDLVETLEKGWLCPECSLITEGPATMTEGYDDCYQQIDDDDQVRGEQIGLADVDGVLTVYRSGNENVSLSDLAPAEGDEAAFGATWSDDSSVTDSGGTEVGTMVLSGAASFTVTESPDVVLADPWTVSDEPYTGGWPQCDPGGPPPSWTLATGEVFPNITLEDQFGEQVDLWDFWGEWIVLDAASVNCGPCQQMAQYEHELVNELAIDGKRLAFITLLNESLSTINLPASLETRQEWAEEFDVHGPILGDQGVAYALFPDYIQDADGSMSFPTVVVIGPDMTVRGWDAGFSEERKFEDLLPYFEE